VEVNIDGVDAEDEVRQSILVGGGDGGEEGGLDGVTGGEGAGGGYDGHGELQTQSLRVNVADVHTTFVGEQDSVTLAARVDADVVLGVCGVRQEGLDDEGCERSSGVLDLTS
jgi:hypothetical protein